MWCDDETMLDNANAWLTKALINCFKFDPDDQADLAKFMQFTAELMEVKEAPSVWNDVSLEIVERLQQYASPYGHTIWKARQAKIKVRKP